MNKYKISVYAICKNESQFVDRWMDSMSEADNVIVLDTGSTDDTVEKLRARGAQVTVEELSHGASIPHAIAPWTWSQRILTFAFAQIWTRF